MVIQNAIVAEMNRNVVAVKQVIVAKDKSQFELIGKCHRTNVMK